MRYWGATLAFVIITGGIAAYLYAQDFRPIIFGAVERGVGDVVASTQPNPDDFRLLFCGTGSPNRTPDRGQPCTGLVANGKLFLFDAGEGAIGKLSEYRAPTGALSAIFLTHLHSDHISGVAEVLHNTWLYGRRTPVSVTGPVGTQTLMRHIDAAYKLDLTERQRVLGAEGIDPQLAFPAGRDIVVADVEGDPQLQPVFVEDGLTISAFLVDHPDWPQAFGYRIEHRGKVVVISGDTRPSTNVRHFSQDADLLIHEAMNMEVFTYIGEQLAHQGAPMPESRIERIASVHTTTTELAELAAAANVPHLVLTHLIPALPANWIADRFFVDTMDEIYDGEITVARDGQWLDLDNL